ncbi:uncharacterized protein LOC128501163 isoform X2 [Spea bombifrons]|uniref:uncharacterized protein LOC128501163 isoform X2 n=1 Tax=Spea bombifrons TaxID=233779 RepID=UPI0023496C16|nr:uncharacterized protein LOC128501163 isoform X2 [Spea bombifrons]
MEGRLHHLIKANIVLVQLGFIVSFFIQISWAFYMNPDISFLLCVSLVLTTNLKGVFLIWFIVSPVSDCVSCIHFLVVSALIGVETSIIAFNLETSYFYTGVLTFTCSVTGAAMVISRTYESNYPTKKATNVVGIFSRSADEEFQWLVNHLRNVGSISPFYISNNNYMDFKRAVSKCSFGILYHSKTRGRLNITDVTDSLYDKELKYLSDVLGKEKVLVVVDDLDDTGAQNKARIQQSQPSIQTLAKDLFLFSTADKHRAGLTDKVGPLISLIKSGSGSWFPAGSGLGAGHIGEELHASRLINTPKAGGWGQVSVIVLISEWLYFLFYFPGSDEIYTMFLIILSNVNGSMLLLRSVVSLPTGLFSVNLVIVALVVAVIELYVIYGILELTVIHDVILSVISAWKALFIIMPK